MRLNTDLLQSAGIDYEHGFSRYAGCAYHFNNALIFAVRNPVFERIACAYTSERMGDMYVYANELKKIADHLGMAEAYEAASILTALLRDGDDDPCLIDTAHTALKAIVATTLSGIRKACV